MYKFFRLPGLFLFILTLCVCGCSGSGSSADPMGTGTVQFVSEYSAPFGTGTTVAAPTIVSAVQVQPSSSLTLTAWVSNFTSDGKTMPVINERVTFTLDNPGNGGRLVALNDRTASNGQARVVYTAGNNLFPDVVRVTTAVGATASVTITKTGTTTRGSVVALPAGPLSVTSLGYSTITATVTDNGLAVQGERVTFTLLANNGASLSVQSGLTNASGQVTTMYLAGNNNIQDVVQAALGNGATAQVIVTKTGTGPGTSIALTSAATSSTTGLTSVAPGRFAIITATVTDSGNNPVSGKLVYFTLTTSNGSIDRTELHTDGKGVASIIYYAWNNLETDILLAWTEGGGYAQLVITKTGQVIGYTATMAANPTEFTAGTGAGPWICNSILTVTVVDNDNLPAPGLRVRFNPLSDVGGVSGASTPSSGLTGVDGKVVTYFRGVLATGTFVVTGYVDVNDNGVQDPTEPTVATTLTVKAAS